MRHTVRTHFIYCCLTSDKQVRTTQIMRGNLLHPLHWLLLKRCRKKSFIWTIYQWDGICITAFVIPVVDHWLKQETAQWVDYMNLSHIQDSIYLTFRFSLLISPFSRQLINGYKRNMHTWYFSEDITLYFQPIYEWVNK